MGSQRRPETGRKLPRGEAGRERAVRLIDIDLLNCQVALASQVADTDVGIRNLRPIQPRGIVQRATERPFFACARPRVPRRKLTVKKPTTIFFMVSYLHPNTVNTA